MSNTISSSVIDMLVGYASQYETKDFLNGDPSSFMHQVEGAKDREIMAFIASGLSYGSRQQFMPRIEWLMNRADKHPYDWIMSGDFACELPESATDCFYRLHTVSDIHAFLSSYRMLLEEHGSLKALVAKEATDGLSAVAALCKAFAGAGSVVPRDAKSACKRVCMFLRWMVRSESPVDIGLWADIIDRRTLIMPLDTHVLQESCRLGLLSSKTTTMTSALRLTECVRQIFPDDPLRADFALFGYGINN